MLAVVIPFFTRPSASERLSGVAATLARARHELWILDIEIPERRRDWIDRLPQFVDGVRVMSIDPTAEETARLELAGRPVVLIDSDRSEGRLRHLMVDDVDSGRLATRHSLELGHRRIGFIGDSDDNPYGFRSSRDRFVGCRQALAGAGLGIREGYLSARRVEPPRSARMCLDAAETSCPTDRRLEGQRNSGRGRPGCGQAAGLASPRGSVGRGM